MDYLTSLPDELILMIIDECDTGDIAALTASNRHLWNVSGRVLYERNISESNSSALLWTVDQHRLDTINHLFAIRRPNGDICANVNMYGTGGMYGGAWRAIKPSELYPHQRFCTPLHIAASRGDIRMMNLLLDHGADIDGVSNRLCQCQYYDTGYNHRGLVLPPDEEPWTPLHTALCRKQSDAAILLINRGANLLVRRDEPGGLGITALHIAASHGMNSVARLLVEKHLPVDVVDSHAITPMVYAARNGRRRKTMQLLRQLGADTNMVVYNAGLRCEVPLFLNLIHAGMYAEAQQAASLGADVHARVPTGASQGHTALHICCYEQKAIGLSKFKAWIELLSRLLREGLAPDARGADGSTPLHFAVTMSTPMATHATNMLIDAGADLNARNNRGETPLLCYCSETEGLDGFGRVEFLTEQGALVDVTDNQGWTPLARICASEVEWPRIEAAECLLRHGADPNAQVNASGAQAWKRSVLAFCLLRRSPMLVALVMCYGGKLHRDEGPTEELQQIFEGLIPKLTRIRVPTHTIEAADGMTPEWVASTVMSLSAAIWDLAYGIVQMLLDQSLG